MEEMDGCFETRIIHKFIFEGYGTKLTHIILLI